MLRFAAIHLRTVLLRLAFFTTLWWVLVEGGGRDWAVGAITILAAFGVSLWLWPAVPRRVSLNGLVAFVGFFLVQSIRGGVAVAVLALRPRLNLQPEVRYLTLRLPVGTGRILLADTLSLLPGTVSADLNGDQLCLHVLDRGLIDEAALRAAETRVARLFGLELPSA
ncbi:MAG: Na+/H+ antiporter subunit E [Thiotrichales bacterium]